VSANSTDAVLIAVGLVVQSEAETMTSLYAGVLVDHRIRLVGRSKAEPVADMAVVR
jgi:hypothetical protein